MVKLYGTKNCTKCKQLEFVLKNKGIDFEKISDENLMIELGLSTIPTLEVDGVKLINAEITQWVNNYNN